MSSVLRKFDHEAMPKIIEKLSLPYELKEPLFAKNDMELFSHLLEQQAFLAAIQFLAWGLPKREAVWWAYIAAEDAEKNVECIKTQLVLNSVSDWVREPNEPNRQKAREASLAHDLYTPSSWAGLAVFWSGDNIAPLGKPIVKPTRWMAGEAVYNAVSLAASSKEDVIGQYKIYLKQGLHIAMGGNGRI